MDDHSKLRFEYSKITDYIFIGTNMCCQTHFRKSLIDKGIKADISLEQNKLDAPFGVDYYLWLPVKDGSPPSKKQLLIGAKFLESLAKNKVKCYVHCEHGHGRAPTLVMAYLTTKGMEAEEALKLIRKKRPKVHPNPKQIRALHSFQKLINRKRGV